MTDWIVRNALPTDRDKAVALLSAAHGSEVRSAAEWDWLFSGRLSHYVVADTGHLLAAQYALLPQRVLHRGSERTALLSLDTATHPSYMRRGLMKALGDEVYSKPGAELIFGFPNVSSAPGLYTKLEWREIGPFPVWVKPLRDLTSAFVPVQLPRLRRRTTGVEVTRIDRWADELWVEGRRHVGTGVVRDAAYLQWRYLDAPRAYRLFATPSREGFAVVRVVPWRRGTLAYLMDAAGDPAALDAATAFARVARAAAIVAVATPRNPLLPELRSRGFRRPPDLIARQFSFGARATGELADHDELFSLAEWHITAGDFDHV